MLKKIKKRFSYLLGAVLAFVFSRISFAENTDLLLPPSRDYADVYGPSIMNEFSNPNLSEPTLWEKILFSPIMIIILILALIIGVIIYFKKKKKNAKKD